MATDTWSRGSAVPLLVALVVMLATQAILVVGEQRNPRLDPVARGHGRRALVGAGAEGDVGRGGLRADRRCTPRMVRHPPQRDHAPATKTTSALFLAYAIQHVFRTSVSGARRSFDDRVAGALTVYLLMGLLGAVLASVIEVGRPGSYSFSTALAQHAGAVPPLAEFRFIYYSFVTLATVGYGDITPVTPVAQTLAWMEAVAGQMYIAIVIATLVSLRPTGDRT